MGSQRTPKSQSNLENKAGGSTFPNFKLYYKTTVTQTVWHWHKNRHTDPWNRIEFKNKPIHIWSINLQNRGRKKIQWRKVVTSKNGAGKTKHV